MTEINYYFLGAKRMSSNGLSPKPIHIVYRVIKFLKSPLSKPYKLLPFDKLLLTFLAEYHGQKGIIASQETMANDLETDQRHIRRRLEFLRKSGLILAKRKGRHNSYTITLPIIEGVQTLYQEIKAVDNSIIEGVQTLIQTNTKVLKEGVQVPNRGSVDPPNSFRTAKSREPLFFEPNELNKIEAEKLGVNLAQELASFRIKVQPANQTQERFNEWLHLNHNYRKSKNLIVANQGTTAPHYEDWTGCAQARIERERKEKQGKLANGHDHPEIPGDHRG